MSKIEEALKKSQTNGLGPRLENSVHGQQYLPQRKSDSDAIARRTASAKEIARMFEPREFNHDELAKRKIIYSGMPDTRVANQFRELRTKILQKSAGESCVVMVTSVGMNSGNSFVALNLAAAFAFDEAKTSLLMDCNLSNPNYQDFVDAGTNLGLTDYLEDMGLSIEQIIHPIGIRRLRLIPAGVKREITIEHFTSIRMKQVFDSINNRYNDRYIILDAPPILDSADAQILLESCDLVLLVVPYGGATQAKIMAAANAIGQQKLLGVVLQIPGLSKSNS